MEVLHGPRHLLLVFTDLEAPPTTNNAYSTFRGKRTLTKLGRAYKASLLGILSRELLTCEQWAAYRDVYYKEGGEIHFTLRWFTTIYNDAWVKRPGTKTDKGTWRSPYKQEDTSNRLKLVEDAVVNATGIDDGGHTRVALEKHHHEGKPYVEVAYNLLLWADV
jgi:hypothetical protein